MRILHVIPTYLPARRYGGPVFATHGLARAQAARGDDVHVFTTNVDGPGHSDVPLSSPVESEGVKVWYFSCGLGRRVYRSASMAKELQRQTREFDIVHAHSAFLWPASAAARFARSCGTSLVISPRGMLTPELVNARSKFAKTLWIGAIGRSLFSRAAAVHVTSEIEKDGFERLGLQARRVEVVPNGVESPMDAPRIVSERPYVLSLGRISWKKGIERLISAFALVPDAELVIAGNDDEGLTPALASLAKRLDLEDRIRFIGPVYGEEKWRLIRNASLFALASRSENFANVVLEAMSCAVPVVITPQVGLSDTVAEVGAGVVVEDHPAALASAIVSLLNDPAKRAAFGAAGQRTALTTFSWSAVAERMNTLYCRASTT